jgi:inhibitor of cysteine peptidase
MKPTLFPVLFFVLLLAACGSAASELQVTDPQQPIEVGAGEEFTIVLEANPTTGYQWKIVDEVDGAVVEFVRSEYKSTSDPKLVGGGGLDLWTFKAVNAGEAEVTLGYYPPSNDPTDPQQTLTFTVIVK